MARAGGSKVFSSGRISVPGRSLSSKKRITPRSAVSGYSLCSTDSEDQVLVINRGLDQCVVLLQDLLQSEGRENTKKLHKGKFPRTHLKSSVKGKKPSTDVHREKGPESAVLFNCRLATSTPTLSPQQPANSQDVPPESSAPSSHQPTRQAGQPSNKQISELDLLQCMAAHLAQLQSQQAACTTEPEKERFTTETVETSSDEEVMMDKATARDVSCQPIFIGNKKSTPVKTEQKIKTVKHLLGEIKALVAEQDNGEALRLVTELEHSLSLLPTVMGSANVLAEITLALQPMRSENTQLRRRLRILNQQLKERERTGRSDKQSCEVTSLQSMNETLQQQLMESYNNLESQQNKIEELLKVTEKLKEEHKTFFQIIQEKEEEILQLQQPNDITSSRVRTDVEDAVGNMKSLQFNLESVEKENQILAITLRQRDAEVKRLRELTRTLQASMAKLLCDLGKDKTKARPGGQLTQAVLDSYDKQLRTDQCPASTSIISYLKRLEMDQVIPTTSDQPDPAVPAYRKGLTSDPSEDLMNMTVAHYNQRPEPFIPSISPQKLRTEVIGESCSLIGDEYKPDETTYLPLARSPHKANFAPSARLMCTPPKVCSAERGVGDKINDFGASERNRTIQRGLFKAADTSDKPTKDQESDVPKPRESSGRHPPPPPPPPLLHHIRNLRISDSRLNDQLAVDVMSATSDWSIASFSTFTSHDEQDFRTGLAALDANIAKLQRTLQSAANK